MQAHIQGQLWAGAWSAAVQGGVAEHPWIHSDTYGKLDEKVGSKTALLNKNHGLVAQLQCASGRVVKLQVRGFVGGECVWMEPSASQFHP